MIPAPTWFGAGTTLDLRDNMASKDAAQTPQPNYEGLQERRLVPGSKVYGKTGCTSLSRTSVWRGVREGWFPSPVSVSPGRIAWFEDEVTSWLASRPILRSDHDTAKQRERLLPAAPRH
jgi:predicted DNA-binding transcriptional regulator AlpA